MFTSRGCPLECAFCESGRHGVIWDRLTRYEPLDIVEYQIKEAQSLGYQALAYYDDILPLHKGRTLKLMELHRKYNMIWRCFLRSDIINNQGGYDYLKELRDGGLVEIFVGIESADDNIKNQIHKKTSIEQDGNIVRWSKELGIRVKCSFILGLPGESHESIRKTKEWILEHRPDRVQVGRLIPFKGTPLTDHPEQYDLQYETIPDDDWFYAGNNEFNKSFVRTSFLTRDEIDIEWHNLLKVLEEEGIPS
jgi:anaerobic magnesium-protoporphyrin IX monomethyl ester cyclase